MTERPLRLKVERSYALGSRRSWEVFWGRGDKPMYWSSCGPTFPMRARADEFAKAIRELIRQGRAR